MGVSRPELMEFAHRDEVGIAAAKLTPDEHVTQVAHNNPVLFIMLLRSRGAGEFDGHEAALLRQGENELAAALKKLEPGSEAEDGVRYWLSPSVPPPMPQDFDDTAGATVRALADKSPLFKLLSEVLPRNTDKVQRTIEDVDPGDYL